MSVYSNIQSWHAFLSMNKKILRILKSHCVYFLLACWCWIPVLPIFRLFSASPHLCIAHAGPWQFIWYQFITREENYKSELIFQWGVAFFSSSSEKRWRRRRKKRMRSVWKLAWGRSEQTADSLYRNETEISLTLSEEMISLSLLAISLI